MHLGVGLEGKEFVVRDKSDGKLVQIPGRPKGKMFNQGKEVGRHPTRELAASQVAELEKKARHEARIVAAKALLGV